MLRWQYTCRNKLKWSKPCTVVFQWGRTATQTAAICILSSLWMLKQNILQSMFTVTSALCWNIVQTFQEFPTRFSWDIDLMTWQHNASDTGCHHHGGIKWGKEDTKINLGSSGFRSGWFLVIRMKHKLRKLYLTVFEYIYIYKTE